MDTLKKRLTKELQQNTDVRIIKSLDWHLPIYEVEIAYRTVKRTTMDILMKMMLIAFEKTSIGTAEELSEILLVEQLFIQDMIDKMTQAEMIEKTGDFFALTDIGIQQLKAGIFVHKSKSNRKTALYSPNHQAFQLGELQKLTTEKKDIYRYAKKFDDWAIATLEDSDLLQALKMLGAQSEEENLQIVVSEIISAVELQSELVACIEFQLHNVKEDVVYVRVWNTLLERWDETLEGQVNEKEQEQWKKVASQEKTSE